MQVYATESVVLGINLFASDGTEYMSGEATDFEGAIETGYEI